MGEIYTRKNIKALLPAEKKDFIQSVLALKQKGTYDQFVRWHVDAMNMGPNMSMGVYPHQGPVFLPWHREFIRRFEKALGLALPYWDWAADSSLADPKKSPIWDVDFLGGNGDPADNYIVKTGPFSSWTVSDEIQRSNGTWSTVSRSLIRSFGSDRGANLAYSK